MKKVLVVEDDPTLQQLLKKLLQNKYKVITKSDGIEAFSWLSARNIPDLIISDIRMPRMDGYEFLEHLSISGFYKNIPVIILTGVNDSASIKRCTDLGAHACVVKPFNPAKFLQTVDFPFVSKMFL